ncbi:MAG: alanine racemase [bacterium]|nr:alanine racemase [bacterium]
MRNGADRGTAWIDIDLKALRSNFRRAADSLPDDLPIIAVVKANAYGHGAIPISRTLVEEGASILGVATVLEARELREAGIEGRILILGRMVAGQIPAALRWKAEITVHHREMAELLSSAAVAKGVTVPVHVKVDTGMTRLGFDWLTAHEEIERVASLPGLDLKCVFTHFANADFADREFTGIQIRRFEELRAKLAGTKPGICCHLANSAAILTGQVPDGSGVRPGLMLYGSPPGDNIPLGGINPILTWKCRIVQVRDVPTGVGISYGHDFFTTRESRIATAAVGYADGFMRVLTNKAQVLVRGKRAPVVGRVTMDMIMVDITDIPEAVTGDEVVLIGRQGDETITAEEMAAWAGTISYEIYCGLSTRVPRFYSDGH